MKAIYLSLSIILSVVILVIAFGNIQAQCSAMTLFFYPLNANTTIVILGISVLGIITGASYHAFITRVLDSSDVDDDEDFE